MTSTTKKRHGSPKTDYASQSSGPQPSELSPARRKEKRLTDEDKLNRLLLADQNAMSQRARQSPSDGDPKGSSPPTFDYLAQPKQHVDACPCCGARPERWPVLSTVDRYTLPVRFVYCARCAFVFANPRMTADAYQRFYAEGHYRRLVQQYSGADPSPDVVWRGQQHHARWLLSEFGPQLQAALAGGGRLLDLGGGPGGVAAGIRSRIPGYAKIVEPAVEEVEHARRNGLDAELGTAESWTPDGQYEVVLLLQTVDHLLDPAAVLRKLRQICTKLLIIDLVNFPDWFLKRQEHGQRGHEALKVDHPSNFHPDALHALLLRSAFRPTNLVELPNGQPRFRRLFTFSAEPAEVMYDDATPGPAAAERIVRGAYQAHTWIGRYHAQPQ